MTTQEIIELAGHRNVPPWVMKLVGDCVAKEREECAKLADVWVLAYDHPSEAIARSTRARGNTTQVTPQVTTQVTPQDSDKGEEHMTKKRKAYLYIITLPFVISAALEFLPPWIYSPIVLVGGMFWVNACACVILSEEKNT